MTADSKAPTLTRAEIRALDLCVWWSDPSEVAGNLPERPDENIIADARNAVNRLASAQPSELPPSVSPSVGEAAPDNDGRWSKEWRATAKEALQAYGSAQYRCGGWRNREDDGSGYRVIVAAHDALSGVDRLLGHAEARINVLEDDLRAASRRLNAPASPPSGAATAEPTIVDRALRRVDRWADETEAGRPWMMDGHEATALASALRAERAASDLLRQENAEQLLALGRANSERDEARAFASRWMGAALYASAPVEPTLAFDPMNPKAFGESRRTALNKLIAQRDSALSSLKAARAEMAMLTLADRFNVLAILDRAIAQHGV